MKEKVDFKEQILEDFKAGKSLFGKDGTLALMIENIVNVAFESEMDAHITDRVLPELEAWRNRTFDEVYPIVWLDATHYKVMD